MKKKTIVRVTKITDDEFDQVRDGVEKYVGRFGVVNGVLTGCITGETVNDPLVQVRFSNGSHDVFWTEELEVVRL